jgi:tetratricopeptide (TPR) repeat protein
MTNKATNPNGRQPGRFRHWPLVICWTLGLGHWGLVAADSVFIGTLERKNAVIKEIRGDALVFEINGREAEHVPLSRVTKLVVVNEAVFNTAEDDFVGGKFDAAVDGYQKTVKGSTKGWLKDWSAMRLIDAANKANRFDAAATAYVAALLKDPAAAARVKPAMPEAKSTYIDTAVAEVNSALAGPKLSDEQKQALLTFLVELHRAKGNTKAAGEAVEQLLKISASAGNNPDAKRALADMKLSVARVALDAKDYHKAMDTIQSSRSVFAEPPQQGAAMLAIAEAQFGLARQSKDPLALKDAGLAYMRFVAHFKGQLPASMIADALLKTGMIHEELGEPAAAEALYQQVVREFSGEPAASEAGQNLQRLRASAN